MATKTITLATTDYNERRNKKHRYLYIEIDTDEAFTVKVKTDLSDEETYSVDTGNDGYQRVKVPIKHTQIGVYWTITIESEYAFKLESVKVLYMPVARR